MVNVHNVYLTGSVNANVQSNSRLEMIRIWAPLVFSFQNLSPFQTKMFIAVIYFFKPKQTQFIIEYFIILSLLF